MLVEKPRSNRLNYGKVCVTQKAFPNFTYMIHDLQCCGDKVWSLKL